MIASSDPPSLLLLTRELNIKKIRFKTRKKPANTIPLKKPVLKSPKPHARQAEINEMAKHHPDVVGLILKQWLKDDGKKKKEGT